MNPINAETEELKKSMGQPTLDAPRNGGFKPERHRATGDAHIAVVVPAYRAERHIENVLRGIPSFVTWVIVIDDASPDQTSNIVCHLASDDPRIHLIKHSSNQGVGGAVLTGYRRACELGAKVIVKVDSDGQMDPAYIPALVSPIIAGLADYTKGNRFLHSQQLRAMPLRRRIGNLGLSFLTKLASGYWNIFDPTNGYTAIHTSIVPLLDQETIDRRYFFESSMFLELSLLRAVIQDVYIPAHYGDENSSLSEFRALFEFPPRLFSGFIRRVSVQYFLQDFSILSLFLIAGSILFLFGLLFGSYHWIRSGQMNIATPTGTIMLSVLALILGVQFLLQAIVLDIQNVPSRPLQQQKTSDLWNVTEALDSEC